MSRAASRSIDPSELDLKDGDLLIVNSKLTNGDYGSAEVLARFRSYRCYNADELDDYGDRNCEPGCCNRVQFFGTELDARLENVQILRRAKVV